MNNEVIKYRGAALTDVKAIAEKFIGHIRSNPETITSADIASGFALSRDSVPRDAIAIYERHLSAILDNEEDPVIVAECEGRIIGFLVLRIEGYGGPLCGMLDEFLVLPEYRGQGIGKSMLTMAIDILRSEGIRTLLCSAGCKNDFAHEFLPRNGFQVVSQSYHLIINEPDEFPFPENNEE